MIKCPECGEKFEEDADLIAGGITYCPECYAELKVVGVDPVKVKAHKDSLESSDYLSDYEEDDDDMIYRRDEADSHEEDDYYEN